MSQFDGYGLALGSVTGLRSFRVDALGRLTGVSVTQTWLPGENAAVCKKTVSASMGGRVPSGMLQMIYGSDPFSKYLSPSYPVSVEPPAMKTVEEKAHEMATCSCGFYAYYETGNDYADVNTISGVIEAYGKVTVGTRGFRAEKARPVALVFPQRRRKNPDELRGKAIRPGLLDRVRQNYPRVAVFDDLEQMLSEFPTTGPELTPDTDPDFWTRGV